ncbi:hypothetical protein ACKS0A_02528 [Histoplasma ohiense]
MHLLRFPKPKPLFVVLCNGSIRVRLDGGLQPADRAGSWTVLGLRQVSCHSFFLSFFGFLQPPYDAVRRSATAERARKQPRRHTFVFVCI